MDMIDTIKQVMPFLFTLVGLAIAVSIDPYISKRYRSVMLLIVGLCAVLVAQNLLDEWLSIGPPRWFLRTTVAVIGYTLRPVFAILFLYIVQPGRKYLGCWALAVANFLLQTTAYYSHLVFWIRADNHWAAGPLYYVGIALSLALMAYWLYQNTRAGYAAGRKDLFVPVLDAVMVLIALYMDMFLDTDGEISLLTNALVIGSVFYYIWLHLRFVREHEEDLRSKQRIQLMLSQIRPHFIFNSLTSIRYLCDLDPKAAGMMTEKFAQYLRGNMDALASDGEVPFTKELEHTKLYLEIEKIRFQDDLRIEYDIQGTDFFLPVLTLQPIVENAVRHGVRGRNGVGTVKISTREYSDHWEVTVSDDGPGFDPEAPVTDEDGREHIGIPNVRSRLEQISNATLRVESAPGCGTTVTLDTQKKKAP